MLYLSKNPVKKAQFFSGFSHRFKLKPTCRTISSSCSVGQLISLRRQQFENNSDSSSFEILGSIAIVFFPKVINTSYKGSCTKLIN